MEDRRELLRKIPKIDEVLQDERLFFFTESTPRSVIVDSVREVIEELRKDILEGKRNQVGTKETLMTEIVARITGKKKKSLRRVINATGVVLHTNLGRANLSDKACESIMDVARNYTNLEYDVKRGSRGSRHDHVEKILTKITGAEAAMVVNNNAAATMLCLSALAKDKEVIVSRGELVEIGGSFRVPEIMEQSGAKLMDVGTTNKTKPSDYLNAYHEGETGALMKVHTSNYRILGFTQEVELPEMVELGKKLNLPVIYDMGSGLMADLTEYGVDEPTVLDALKTGIDVILFSGDKLLGGPQGGIIAGKKEYIDKMKAHPLARAFRVDKMTLAAMEATFFEYSDIRQARKTIPVLNMITTPAKELKDKAERLAEAIRGVTHNFTVEVEACKDQVGGGSAPTVLLDGYAVAIQGRALTPEKIERLLRKEEIPIIVRITHNQVYLDVRTIREDEFEYIVAAFLAMDSRQVEG
ncbi:L-seryl-tRNA(Sec) selenium transferase [Clostridium sp. 1001283B150225_161107_B6]